MAAVVATLFALAGVAAVSDGTGGALVAFAGGAFGALAPNIGDQAKPIRGAKLKSLLTLF